MFENVIYIYQYICIHIRKDLYFISENIKKWKIFMKRSCYIKSVKSLPHIVWGRKHFNELLLPQIPNHENQSQMFTFNFEL